MCGICGVMIEDHQEFSVGSILYEMMQSQQIRAQDSTGIAVFAEENPNFRLSYFVRENGAYEIVEEEVPPETFDAHIRELMSDPRILVTALGREMRLIKDIGLARDLNRKYDIQNMEGTHGTAHLRIATSSRVTPYNAHPFSTVVMPDIAIVHNGEITNYRRLRDRLELEGYPFMADCDSEVIAVYLADRLLKHGDPEKAHYEFIRSADGPFTYIAATGDSLAMVRDRFGMRKGMVGYAEGNDHHPPFWAMATDLSALVAVGANRYVEAPNPGKPRIFYKR